MALRTLVAAAALSALAGLLTACGGETAGPAEPAGAADDSAVLLEDEQLEAFARAVEDMGIVEWRGELSTKAPEHGGRQIFGLSGRFSPSTGYSEVTMESAIDGVRQQVDYLVVAGRTYFNSEAWGPSASDCWDDITGDAARTWGLPTQLDPTWPLSASRAVRLQGEGVRVAIPARAVLTGMPRGLFPAVPPVLKGVEAGASIIPHGPLLEVGVDVATMWADVPEAARATIETRGAGWWSMTMQEARDGLAVKPPTHVFDPQVISPRHCMRA